MSDRSIARRYAAALFDVAKAAGSTDQAGRDLSAFAGMVAGHVQLQQVLATPAIPAARKKAVIDALAEAAHIGPEVRRTLLMLAERDRLSVLADLVAAFSERQLQERRILPAEVMTAAPLSDTARRALMDALGKATGSTVTLTERVDPAVIGGIVTRVGGTVFDGSVSRQLERLRQKLVTEA